MALISRPAGKLSGRPLRVTSRGYHESGFNKSRSRSCRLLRPAVAMGDSFSSSRLLPPAGLHFPPAVSSELLTSARDCAEKSSSAAKVTKLEHFYSKLSEQQRVDCEPSNGKMKKEFSGTPQRLAPIPLLTPTPQRTHPLYSRVCV